MRDEKDYRSCRVCNVDTHEVPVVRRYLYKLTTCEYCGGTGCECCGWTGEKRECDLNGEGR